MQVLKCLYWLLLAHCSVFASHAPWVNFLGNQSCTPYQQLQPKTLQELHASIQCTKALGHKIRIVGNGYSISGLISTGGCLLSLKYLNKILCIDPVQLCVRVEAGITLKALNEQLARHCLALPNQTAIDQISLGGALATASHGTGHSGTFSSFVKEIELITADGKLRHLSAISDPEGFAAAKTSLGALGVIYAVTLQVMPLFYLYEEHETTNIDTVLAQYRELFAANDFFQFTWNVHDGKALVQRWNRCPQNHPSATLCYNALNYYPPDPTDKDLFSEIAIPIESLPKIIQEIQSFLKRYHDVGMTVADVVVRFANADEETYLSPAANHSTAYLTMSICKDNHPLAPRFYEEFETLMLPFCGRPHWGKIHFLNYEKALYLYGNNFRKFVQAKQRLDPQGTFSNALIDQICTDPQLENVRQISVNPYKRY